MDKKIWKLGMSIISICSSFSLALLLFTTTLQANEAANQLPNSEQIREYYQKHAVAWGMAPAKVLNAFVAAEDRYYYEKPSEISTITRQVGRWFLPPRSSRFQRYVLAFVIADTLTHDEILNMFVNEIFLGQNCFGVAGGAAAYFGKAADELNLQEAAYLAALPKAPSSFHPTRSYDRAILRRNYVLAEMGNAGFITDDDASVASQTDLIVVDPILRCQPR